MMVRFGGIHILCVCVWGEVLRIGSMKIQRDDCISPLPILSPLPTFLSPFHPNPQLIDQEAILTGHQDLPDPQC